MNIARLIIQLGILSKYNLEFAVQLTEQFVTLGFITRSF